MNLPESWYYVQAFNAYKYEPIHFVVIAGKRGEALDKANTYLARLGKTVKDINLYKNNYKRESEALIFAGKVA
jgi:hypothetical protein